MEIARLTAIIEEKKNQIAFWREENERLRNGRDTARTEAAVLSSERRKMEEKIADLEETVRRQARTIKVQSEQIAAPKEANRTPVRGAGTFGLENRPQFYPQPAPVYNPPPVPATASTSHHGQRTQTAPSYPPVQATASTSYHVQRTQTAPSFTAQQAQAISRIQTNSLQTSAPNRNTLLSQGPSSALVVQGDEMPRVNWIEEFSEFFDLTLTFCRNFANVPNDERDNALSGPLLSELQRLSHPAVVRSLLGSSDTRYYLVTSLLNHTVCADIFRSSLVKGYTSESDQKLGQIRSSIKPGLKVSMKRGLVKAAADTLIDMRKTVQFQQWIENQIDTKASILWDRIDGLLTPGVERQDAFDNLNHVFKEAYRIGLMMYSVPYSWTIDFPAVAETSFFDPTTMINKDVQFLGDPVSLRQQRLRVRLAMTPIIVALNYMDEAIMPRTVHFAQVLLQC